MKGKIINDRLLAQITERFEKSDRKEELKKYIAETVSSCNKMCMTGLNIRVLNSFKFMIENLAKELGL